jgi:hypothetical protein
MAYGSVHYPELKQDRGDAGLEIVDPEMSRSTHTATAVYTQSTIGTLMPANEEVYTFGRSQTAMQRLAAAGMSQVEPRSPTDEDEQSDDDEAEEDGEDAMYDEFGERIVDDENFSDEEDYDSDLHDYIIPAGLEGAFADEDDDEGRDSIFDGGYEPSGPSVVNSASAHKLQPSFQQQPLSSQQGRPSDSEKPPTGPVTIDLISSSEEEDDAEDDADDDDDDDDDDDEGEPSGGADESVADGQRDADEPGEQEAEESGNEVVVVPVAGSSPRGKDDVEVTGDDDE